MLNWLSGKYEPQKAELPESWQDERIQSSAALLGLGVDVLVKLESAEDAMNRLANACEDLGLDPDQIHRAIAEHEPILAFQEPDDELLRRGTFRILAPWDPRREEI